MNITVTGALVGTGVALLVLALDYSLLRAGATERAKRSHRKYELDRAERKQIASIASFCVFVPPAFAAFFWLLWG